MKSLVHLSIIAGAFGLSLAVTCQSDVNVCKSAYDNSVQQAKEHGSAPVALCNGANTFLSCLRDMQRQNCTSVLPTVNNYTQAVEEQLNRTIGDCRPSYNKQDNGRSIRPYFILDNGRAVFVYVLCGREVDACETAFKNSRSQAGNDLNAICMDGNQMVLCLQEVDNRKECTAERTHIEQQRKTVEEKLTQGGCDTYRKCYNHTWQCSLEEAAAKKNAITYAQMCTAATNYYNCLASHKNICAGEFLKDLNQAIDDVQKELNAGNCSHSGVIAQHQYSSATPLLASLALAMVVLLE